MISRSQPPVLAFQPAEVVGGPIRSTTRLFNAALDFRDTRDVDRPYLAEAVPQLNTDTWRVFPDGRMETTYRLKPNLTWHDGTPLTADDFVFAWTVHSRTETRVNGLPPQMVEDVQAPDARTILFRWRVPYPEAGALDDAFQPLPRHILAATFEQESAETFRNHRFWTAEYVGLGPYRLDHWEAGTSLEGVAFDGHVWGRPRIDRVQVRFIEDESSVLANLLSEAAHVATDSAIRFEGGTELNRQWGESGKGTARFSPGQVRLVLIQFRPDVASPRAQLDVRTRRALSYATDKSLLNDGLFEGQGVMIETPVPPSVPYFAELDRALPKYPYDPRRAEQLMGEAGFTRGGDGIWVGADGERFAPRFYIQGGAINERQGALLADSWRRSGIDAPLEVYSAARARDLEYRATFTGLQNGVYPGRWQERFHYFATAEVASAQTRWVGFNRSAWSNAEYDRLSQLYSTTLDPSERARQAIQMERIRAEEVAAIPLFFNLTAVAYLGVVQGPDPNLAFEELLTSNIHEWDLR
jgi:peptide/nickel transport system substrate-binding protein